MKASVVIRTLRNEYGFTRKGFAEHLGIPLRTVEDWESGKRNPPEYVPRLILYQLKVERQFLQENKKHAVDIVRDADGNRIVMINDLRFKGRRNVDWKVVEECLKEYIGDCAEITETSDMVYIGSDFPDEYVHSEDTKKLGGASLYAKANASCVVKELLEIATNKTFADNYNDKHNTRAKFGWYRYDSRFAIPVYNDDGELERYNIFKARIVARHAKDGKLYLYDILRIKKETSRPLEQ